MDVWLFGYGSLIWRPDIAHRERRRARVQGWTRRFWQGSHDHRGLPHAPGRVVTLVPDATASCDGIAYLIDRATVEATFEQLDYREKNGYARHAVRMQFAHDETVTGVVYVATRDNHAFLGPAPLADMVEQIRRCAGPSGPNAEYLLELASALRAIGADDPHVFELEALLRAGGAPSASSG